MADTLTQNVTHESFTTGEGNTLLLTLLATTLLSQGVIGPQGPAGTGGDEMVPEFPIIDVKSSSSLGSGDSVNLDSVIVPDFKIGKVQQVTLSCSAAAKWVIQKMYNGVSTTLDIVFTSGLTGNAATYEWEPPHRDYAELTGDGTTTFYRVSTTNLDGRNPANVYVTFMFDEVDE